MVKLLNIYLRSSRSIPGDLLGGTVLGISTTEVFSNLSVENTVCKIMLMYSSSWADM